MKMGYDYEKHIAKRYNGQTTPASGAFIHRKLDVDNVGETKVLRISAKEHEGSQKTISVKYSWLDQASGQVQPGEIPVLFYKNLKNDREIVVFEEEEFHKCLGHFELSISDLKDEVKMLNRKISRSQNIYKEVEELERYKEENEKLINKVYKLDNKLREMKRAINRKS